MEKNDSCFFSFRAFKTTSLRLYGCAVPNSLPDEMIEFSLKFCGLVLDGRRPLKSSRERCGWFFSLFCGLKISIGDDMGAVLFEILHAQTL
jgi:hypothetical protein